MELIDILRVKVEVDFNVKFEMLFECEVFERFKKFGLGFVKVKKVFFNVILIEDDICFFMGIDERKICFIIKCVEMVVEVGRIVNSGGVFILEKIKVEVVLEVLFIFKESFEEVKDVDEFIEFIDKLKKEIKEKFFS